MRVDNFIKKYDILKNEIVFLANFSFESRKDLDCRVWFRIAKKEAVKNFPYNGFFCAAYPLAQQLNEELIFAGPASLKLYKNILKINELIGLKKNKRKVVVERLIKHETRNGKERGLFFTMGLDSFYSLIKFRGRIDSLVFVNGYDVYPKAKRMLEWIKKEMRQIGRIFNCKQVIVSTNLRYDLSEKFMPWVLFHGAALAAAGYAVGKTDKFLISGSDQYRSGIAWGTGFKQDRLWSSESISFGSFAGKINRINKIKRLARMKKYREIISEKLRVCWQNFGEIPKANCLKCEKCLRTYLNLKLAGFKEPIRAFKGIRAEEIMNLKLVKEKIFIWQEIAEEIKKSKWPIKNEIKEWLPLIEEKISEYRNGLI